MQSGAGIDPNAMPANLSPEYKDAEAAFRAAREPKTIPRKLLSIWT